MDNENYMEPISDGFDIPNFDLPEKGDKVFPAGKYLCAFGRIKPVYMEGMTSGMPLAVIHDMWIVKYLGTEDKVESQTRIARDENNDVTMDTHHGTRVFERYPSPVENPKMAWKSRSFFEKFKCVDTTTLTEFKNDGTPKTKTVVDWTKVQAAVGTLFTLEFIYNEGKVKNGEDAGKTRNFRNIDYETIVVLDNKIPVESIKAMEVLWQKLKDAEDSGTTVAEPTSPDDLPF